ncbi:hypothetical protein [Sphingomonas paeninsulae]|uniref:FliH/SctL family protein n=1 Tax=Sphingomonas paeninsulae TaxID=2319844 RepID=UPI0013CF214F|nr:hypothetical protein [Sphingomonas paeninsulae]
MADEMAQSDRYAEGLAEGRRIVEQEFQAERVALLSLVEQASQIEPCDPEPLATLLSEAVLRLVEDIVGKAPVDTELLCMRARTLAGAICGSSGPVVLYVCPENIDLVTGLGDGIEIRADSALASGALRLTVGESAAEDGPSHALDRLRVAMRDLAA